MRISETKNKNEKKITETGIETKTSALFDAYSNSPVERTEGCCCYTNPGFYKESSVNKTMRFLNRIVDLLIPRNDWGRGKYGPLSYFLNIVRVEISFEYLGL